MLRTSQKKFAPAQVGLQVPDVDRARADNRNVLAVVVGIEDSDFYKLANKNGALKQLYTRNQFVISKEKVLSTDEIYFQEMSLIEAAANSRSAGADVRKSKKQCINNEQKTFTTLLHQNMFHMTTTTGEETFQTSDKSSNGRVQHVRISDRLYGPDRYTRDFKYPHNQKSAGVKSGDRGGHGYLQRLLTILSSPNVCIRNALTGIHHSLLRSQKSQESREQRLENDRIQHAVSRSLQSNDSRERRLEADSIRHAASRSLGSDDSIE
ncbi:KRAB-A domain-containing protein 2 [Trichonephila clavipes]|nr:KRAB-A domain-containing protein 2 [Trichonephila clavipes]